VDVSRFACMETQEAVIGDGSANSRLVGVMLANLGRRHGDEN